MFYFLLALLAHGWAYSIGRPRRPSLSVVTSSAQKPLGQSKPNFMSSVNGMFVQMILATRPRWSLCPYMVKQPFKNRLWNQQAGDIGTWYSTMETRTLQCLFKWWSWVDLVLLYGKVNFGLVWGKCSNTRFYRSYWSLWIERWYILTNWKWLHEYIWVPEDKVTVRLFSKIT